MKMGKEGLLDAEYCHTEGKKEKKEEGHKDISCSSIHEVEIVIKMPGKLKIHKTAF